MLNESQQGFGKDGKPTGYVRIEIKNDMVKVLVHTQNIVVIEKNKSLEANLLSSNKKDAKPFSLGKLALSQNGGDLIYGFNIKDLARVGQEVSSIDTAVIVLKGTDKSAEKVSFPLAGFKNGEWDYKKVFDSIKASNEKNTEDKVEKMNEAKKTDKTVQTDKVTGKDIEIQTDKTLEPEITIKSDKDRDMRKAEGTDSLEAGNQKEKELKHTLSDYPACERPFACGDLGYSWHNIDNLKFILENEYSNERIMYLMYNYNVMNAIYRYNHFLFGIDNCSTNESRRIAFAVPSRYGIEPNPLIYAQPYARWIAKNGEKTVAGALGYWMVVIDTQNGCFMI